MAKKAKKDDNYYNKKLEELEKRKQKLIEEENKTKGLYREWKLNQIIALLEKYSLIDIITDKNLNIFDECFKNISGQIDKNLTSGSFEGVINGE